MSHSEKNIVKKPIKYIGNIVTILAIVFIIRVMLSFDIDTSIIKNKSLFITSSIFGIFIMCSTVYLIAYGWKIILTVLSNHTVNYSDASFVYTKANMGKYLPGNVMHYVERNLFAGNLGLNQKTVLLSTVIEIIGQVSVCLLAGVILERKRIIAISLEILQTQYIIIFAVLLCILLAGIIIFRDKIKKILSDISITALIKAFIRVIPIYLTFVLLGSLVLVVIFTSTTNGDMSHNTILSIVAAYTTAWVLGFIVPGSPGGIGVREFVLLFLLRDLFPEPVILTCILVHRMISVLGDVFAYLISILRNKLRSSSVL